ncbi:MAG: LemA family protein [Candidatus Altiarchaeota archaeon]
MEFIGLSVGVMLVAAAAVILLPAIVVLFIYNGLIGKRNQSENTFATIDVMLKKRYDLIPNLVSTVQGYAAHEKGVFERVTELRAQAMKGGVSDDEKVDINNRITGALKTIFAVAENYPDLKANKNFLHLQATMTELEEQISAARRAYNAAVLEFNNGCDMFPSSIVASAFRFRRKAFFQAQEAEKEVPKAFSKQ